MAKTDIFLGIDVGSVSTNLVALDMAGEVISYIYLRTQGQPIVAVQKGLVELEEDLRERDVEIRAVGTTGSARYLSGVIVGADIIKNEITAHAVAASHVVPNVRTVLEIGGQDSKIILLKNGIVVDFAMNTVCAAGTGSFLDHQAVRLGIPIEKFGSYALNSTAACQIAGRCSVFAESDMIHKQQMGYPTEDIVYGLCQALVRNYLNNLAKGKEILAPIVFQGGVAANAGMKRSFEDALKTEVMVPEHFHVMGALGAALLAKNAVGDGVTRFKGFAASSIDYKTSSFNCKGCANNCEVVKIEVEDKVLARWGGRCGKWEVQEVEEAAVG
ncbi:MAG: acyl-CoA dehydratase activase [Candidatus Aquicultorales bacterium]